MKSRKLPLLAALVAGIGFASNASALFSDDEARVAINAMRKQMTAMQGQIDQLETAQKANLSIANQIEQLRQSQSALSGRIEVLENQVAQQQKNSKELYADLDARLRALSSRTTKLEPVTVTIGSEKAQVMPAEKSAFDAGLAAFQDGKYEESIAQFRKLEAVNPRSAYAPEALYWEGNARFALQQYKEAAEAEDRLIRSYSSSSRLPDAMLSLASAQTALGNVRAAYSTYQTLASRYPDTDQARVAAERMTELKPALPASGKKSAPAKKSR